jgi:hypothetical protein
VLVTGSTDGLGREVALRVAATGAHVIVHGRNRERGLEVVGEIERAGAGSASFHAADLASLAEVRALGETVLREHDRLDVLVNNAGIWLNDGERRLSEDGYELHFAVNYLSGFLLTRLLLPRLLESAPSRVVNVASAAQTPLDFDDVMLERGGRAYAQSKARADPVHPRPRPGAGGHRGHGERAPSRDPDGDIDGARGRSVSAQHGGRGGGRRDGADHRSQPGKRPMLRRLAARAGERAGVRCGGPRASPAALARVDPRSVNVDGENEEGGPVRPPFLVSLSVPAPSPGPPGFVPGDVGIGFLMHRVLGVPVGLIYAALLPRLRLSPVAGGLVTGALLYGRGFWLLPQLFPRWLSPFWLPPTGRALQAAAHAVYGVVFGAVYARLDPPARRRG